MARPGLCFSLCTFMLVVYQDLTAATLPGMLFPRESESREIEDLSGLWDFRADTSRDRNVGFEKMWFKNSLKKTGKVIPMPVPASYNDMTQNKSLRDFIGWAWYDRRTYVPRSWKDPRTRVVLRFESAHYYSIVWVNGEKVMEHEGGHLPFEADVSEFLYYDQPNRITAAVNNTLTPTTLPPGEIQYVKTLNWHPPGYFVQSYKFDFFNYAGIHRPVKLYTTPVVYLSDITITTHFQYNTGTVKFLSVVGAIKTIPRGDISMSYELLDKDNYIVASQQGVDMFEGVLSVSNPILWWPIGMSNKTAYLYTLKVTTSSSALYTQDVYRIPVGIRTIKVEGTKFLINDRPFYFKGFGKHEDADIRGKGLDNVLIAKDFNLIKWLGGNSFRTSHYPYAEEIMDMADRTGIVVIDECPGVGIKNAETNLTPQSQRHHIDVMREFVRRDKNRPAVVMWSVANEPCSDKPEALDYFEPIFRVTRKMDPTRPVTFVTPYRAFLDKVVPLVDVIMFNRYYAWYADAGETQLISRQVERNLRDFYVKYKKPVIMAEYGADTVAGLHSDPPLMFTEEYQVETIQQYFPVFDKLRKEFFVGEMIWNFADFMTAQAVKRVAGNKKGILTRQRQPKAAAFILRQRYLNITLEQNPTSTGDELLDALVRFDSRTPTNTGNPTNTENPPNTGNPTNMVYRQDEL